MRAWRLILAFAVAPAVAPGACYFYPVLLGDTEMPRGFLTRTFAPLAYGVALIVGIPLYVLLSDRDLDDWWHYALAGAVLGTAPFILFFGTAAFGSIGIMGAASGLLAAVTFWWIAVWQRGVGNDGV
jgi:hypothetical protein